MTVEEMLDEVIKREGGFSHFPQDRGGATKFGITQRTLSAWRGEPESAEAVKFITEEEAKAIYRALYYTRPKINSLPPPINSLVFDYAVNSGPQRAIMALQESLGISSDGVIGPATLAAVSTANPRQLTLRVTAQRIRMYVRIAKKDPSQLIFLEGWCARALSFLS